MIDSRHTICTLAFAPGDVGETGEVGEVGEVGEAGGGAQYESAVEGSFGIDNGDAGRGAERDCAESSATSGVRVRGRRLAGGSGSAIVRFSRRS
jgi:hypothetical protein